MESLFEASEFVRAVERSQGLSVSVVEEIAYQNGWIDRDRLLAAADKYGKSVYGQHLKKDVYKRQPLYNEANNISSILAAGDILSNAYVLESDLLLYNPKLITKYQYASNYLGVPVEVTDDWCFHTRSGVITGLSVGGTDCHHMFGVSYWSAEDGKRLATDIPATYSMPVSYTHLACQWLITILVVRLSSGYEAAGTLSLAMSVYNIFAPFAIYRMYTYQVSDVKRENTVGEYFAFRIITSSAALVCCLVYAALRCV